MSYLLAVGNWVLPLLYLALLIDYGATFFLRARTHVRSPWLMAVVLVHAAMLTVRAVYAGHPPVTYTRDILSVLAVALAAVYAYVELANRDRRTGVFVVLLAFLFQYTSSILLAGQAGETFAVTGVGAPSLWTRLHVLSALVAYTASALAGVYGLLYLLAQRGLHQHRFGVWFDRLPPLDLLGTMTWHALLTGFVCLTLAIAITPLLFHGGGQGEMTPKVIAKIITGSVAWLIYATAILGRWLGKWPAPRISIIAVAGSIVVMALLVASGLLS